MGAPFYVPGDLIETLWQLIKQSVEALIMLDCIDDDQQLLLMAYKLRRDLFEIHESDWFLPLKEYGGEHLTIREKGNQNIPLKHKVKLYIQRIQFANRCYRTAKKYDDK